jgi:hypothetical protein
MTYLSQKGDLKSIAIEDSNREGIMMPPLFYLEKWVQVMEITSLEPAEQFYRAYDSLPQSDRPKYIVFMQDENRDKRVAAMKVYFPNLQYEATIEPSYIDKLMHFLNPVNKNQTSYIYRID